VRQKVEIYNYDGRIEHILRKIKDSSISKKNKSLILDFHRNRLSCGLSKVRQYKYLYTLERITRVLKKDFESVTKDDIIDLLANFEKRNFSEWSKHDYKVVLKIFFRWLRKTDEYPPEVKWIKTTVRNSHLLPDEILTEEEVKTMAENADNLRDKAFILVLYESGCRVSEILTLQIRNVQFDQYGAILIVTGKTGDRRIRIIASAPKLFSWIENHPLRDRMDAPLWTSLSLNNRHNRLSYRAVKDMLKEVAKKSGVKKRVYPHLFRHSRATFLAGFLTEAQLKQYFGWVQSSDMASTYVHLSGRDVDNALFKLQGIEVKKQEKEVVLKTVLCPRCSEKNSPESKFCMRCGSPLDVNTALKLDELRAKADKLMTILIKDPKILEKLLEKLEEIPA